MKITVLTNGSHGDVQPFIALAVVVFPLHIRFDSFDLWEELFDSTFHPAMQGVR